MKKKEPGYKRAYTHLANTALRMAGKKKKRANRVPLSLRWSEFTARFK